MNSRADTAPSFQLLSASFNSHSFLLNQDPSSDAWARCLLLSAVTLSGAEGGSLIWFESRPDALNLTAFRATGRPDPLSPDFPVERSESALHEGLAFSLYYSSSSSGEPTGALSPQGAHSTLLLPVRTHDQVYGVIHLYSLAGAGISGGALQPGRMELLKTFALTVALIVENKRNQGLLLRENEALRLLGEGSAELDLGLGSEELAQKLLGRCLRLSRMGRGALLLAGPGGRLELAASRGLEREAVEALGAHPLDPAESQGLVNLLRQGGLTLDDLSGQPGLSACFPPELKAFACLPLTEGAGLMGAVFMADAFQSPPQWRELLQAVGPLLGDQASRALRACRLVAELRQKSADLERAMRSLVQSEKLALVGQLAAAVAHQIRNPLSVIGANVELMMGELAGDDPHHAILETLSRKVAQTDATIRELLELARPLSLEVRPCGLKKRIENIAAFIAPKCRLQGVELELNCETGLPEFWLDPVQFERCLLDLAINALQQMPSGGRLSLGCAHEGLQRAALWVSDTGPGVDPALCERIFEPFFSLRPGGTGLGLYNVRRICNEMGIEITLRSAGGLKEAPGASFLFLLPLSIERPQPILPLLRLEKPAET